MFATTASLSLLVASLRKPLSVCVVERLVFGGHPHTVRRGISLRWSWLSDGRASDLDDDEIFIFAIAGFVVLVFTPYAFGWPVHRLFRRGNAAAGLPLLAVAASLAWIGFVISYYADPSVEGIYAAFYAVIGLALTVGLGFYTPRSYGLRVGVDIYERKNMAAAMVISSFALATGMIFGGSLWGDADPVGDDEGGWWIPLGFFLVGWGVLILAAAVYIAGEPRSLRMRLVQDRSVTDAWAASSYVLGIAAVLTEAVAGDFWGWSQGLLGLLVIAGMVVTHQLCSRRMPALITTVESRTDRWLGRRQLESMAYAGFAILFWLLQRGLDRWAAGVDR